MLLQHIFDFNYPKLADFGAAVSNATKSERQAVLEELDVSCPVTFPYNFSSCLFLSVTVSPPNSYLKFLLFAWISD